MSLDLDTLMEFTVSTAHAAGNLTRSHFGSAAVELKGDGSEVTIADRGAEELIRSMIAERFPDHGFFGEEGARTAGAGEFRWIVDPIDGTRSFASGVPLYGVLLALEHRGSAVLGCAHFPELNDTVVAATGAGCWRNGRAARVSECDSLDQARIVTSGLEYWRDWATPEARAGFDALLAKARFGRTWGDCFGYVLVATGRAEILADPACGAYWDYLPVLPIVREAGGEFTSLRGDPVESWSSALATNGQLHAAASGFWSYAETDRALQTHALHARRDG